MAQEKIRPTYDGYLINFSSSNGYPTIFVNGKMFYYAVTFEKKNTVKSPTAMKYTTKTKTV